MKQLCGSLAALLLAAAAPAQQMPPNAPHYVRETKVPGLEVRYLDFKWDPEAFATLEKGGDHPVGRRSWVLASLRLPSRYLRWEGKTVPVGVSILILNPARASAGPTFEVRKIDLRDVFTNLNVIAEPPPGETVGLAPAVFRKADTAAQRLELALSEREGAVDLTVHYGDRQASIRLTR